MKQLLVLMSVGLGGLLGFGARAQGPDKAEYQQRFDDCRAKEQQLRAKLDQKRHDREQILKEYRSGQFCSDCKRSRTEVEQQMKMPFSQHIAASKTRYVISATPEQIAQKKQQLDDDVHNIEVEVDSKRLDCEAISMSYDKAQKAALAAAQQQAQQAADHHAQQQADEQARLLAAQQQRAEEERRRREEAERLRQAQLAANILAYQDRLNQNNAETQARLDEQRQNSTLRDVPTYDRRAAQQTVSSTSTRQIGDDAFSSANGKYLGGLYTTTRGLLQEHMNSLIADSKEYIRDKFVEKSNDMLWGAEDTNEDNNNEAPWTVANIKNRIKSAAVHKVADAILEVDKKTGGFINQYYQPYKQLQEEASYYEPRRLTDFLDEHVDFIGQAAEKAGSFEDVEEFNAVGDKLFQYMPKKFSGVVLKWFTEGRRAPLDELVPSTR